MKNYIAEIIDLTTDSYINPAGAAYGDGTGTHQRSLESIDVLGVHHDATPRPHDYDSVARYKQEAKEHYLRLGPGLQYHYKIDNTGQIFYTRPLTTWLYAVGSEANTRGVWICLDGYFHPDVNQKPTREQYEALSQLIIELMTNRPDVPNLVFPNVTPHSSFSPTACCGDTLRPYVLGVVDEPTALAIPTDVVYDWPEQQPAVSVPNPPVDPIQPPVQPDQITFEDVVPARYFAQVKTHLDDADSGERIKDYDPTEEFDIVRRMRKGVNSWLQTPYSVQKFPTRGIPEKDLLLKHPGTPIPPSEPDPNQAPPVVEVPPTPSLPEQSHDYSKENNNLLKQILGILQWLRDKITSILK
jgi:hypothetical protein